MSQKLSPFQKGFIDASFSSCHSFTPSATGLVITVTLLTFFLFRQLDNFLEMTAWSTLVGNRHGCHEMLLKGWFHGCFDLFDTSDNIYDFRSGFMIQ